ncbi:MAG TPA: DUF4241 domain-containing protein [Candidatus Limnocylindrales bacterium]
MQAALRDNEHRTWSWVSVVVDPPTAANVVGFSSGMGDGAYASFVGFASDGRAVAVRPTSACSTCPSPERAGPRGLADRRPRVHFAG